MPLIIIVLAIIVAISWSINSSKEQYRKNKEYTASARKTNAQMERSLVDKYMKLGKCFDEAFEMAKQDMLEAGFEPCIPRDAYKPRYWSASDEAFGHKRPETSECYNCEQYDSHAVQMLKSDYRSQCQKRGVAYSKNDEDKYVYGDKLPTSAGQYSAYLTRKLKSHQHDAVPVGNYISCLGLGTCEIVDLDYESATHIVKVVQSGEIRRIPFGDKRITKL